MLTITALIISLLKRSFVCPFILLLHGKVGSNNQFLLPRGIVTRDHSLSFLAGSPHRTQSHDCAVPSTMNSHVPSISASAVLGDSEPMSEDHPICKGHDFSTTTNNNNNNNNNSNNTIESIMSSMLTTGFQATNVGLAIYEVKRMRAWRLSDVAFEQGVHDESLRNISVRKNVRARIFLAYTSNQISCGQREVIRYLVQHKMVDVMITTAGGIEEDIVKCLGDTYMGDFTLDGRTLRKRGINRIGNLLVPNVNYCKFEDWLTPLIERLHDEQDERWTEMALGLAKRKAAAAAAAAANGNINDESSSEQELLAPYSITPSEFISRLGKEINNESSVLYWAHRNNIPIFCPALTDGSMGDMIYFHSYKRPGFTIDIARDIRRINDLAIHSHATGQIILGGGVVKHHTCNANLMRNGADFSVYINTGMEFDGSDSGASPDEAISWGKIRSTARPVKVCADATIVFPLIVSQTFATNVDEWMESTKDCVCWM